MPPGSTRPRPGKSGPAVEGARGSGAGPGRSGPAGAAWPDRVSGPGWAGVAVWAVGPGGGA
ncbi:hypothetical protein AMK16_24025 [Streptomyces sp. CB00455]|nr:hypothetical protein AMK16_24025 [Streptomyces sp. CB00455]